MAESCTRVSRRNPEPFETHNFLLVVFPILPELKENDDLWTGEEWRVPARVSLKISELTEA